MIGSSTFTCLALMISFGVFAPIALSIWWVRTRNERFTTVLAGAATWFVFAVILEALPKALLFNPKTSIGKTVMGNGVLFTSLGALLAGLFEETGRLIVFRTVLRERRNRETSIAHGIGHGGFEAFFLLVVTSVQNFVYASMINAGTFRDMVNQTAARGVDVTSLQLIPMQLMSLSIGNAWLSIMERVFAIALHVGLSIMVFSSVRRSRTGLYVLAVLLHALFDVPAALYQFGVISNVIAVEVLLGVYSVVFLVAVHRTLYRRREQDSTLD